MLAMVLPLPRASLSSGTGAECFFAHAGSADIASGPSLGGVPVKVMVPLTDEAAKATLGQTDNATSPAASHNLFRVPRMLGSLVTILELARHYTGHAVRATPWRNSQHRK